MRKLVLAAAVLISLPFSIHELLAANELEPCVYVARATAEEAMPELQPHGGCARQEEGVWIFEASHLERMSFGETGLAAVLVHGWHYVTPEGRSLAVLTWDNGPDELSDGLVRGLRDGKMAYFNTDFQEVIPPVYDWGWPFNDGRALVCSGCKPGEPMGEHTPMVGGSWGYINTGGKEIVPVLLSREEAFAKGRSGALALAPPRDLEEALERLATVLPEAEIEKIRTGSEEDLWEYHFGLGLWMRNNWGLWEGLELAEWFQARGVEHGDDMSSIILRSFWRRLNNKPLDLDREIEESRAFYRLSAKPDPESHPGCPGGVDTTQSFGPKHPVEALRGVHMGQCCADGSVWSYHVDRGWYRPKALEISLWQEAAGRYDPCED